MMLLFWAVNTRLYVRNVAAALQISVTTVYALDKSASKGIFSTPNKKGSQKNCVQNVSNRTTSNSEVIKKTITRLQDISGQFGQPVKDTSWFRV